MVKLGLFPQTDLVPGNGPLLRFHELREVAQMAEQLGGLSGMVILRSLLGAVVMALSIAIFGGAVATAAKELTVNLDEIADTFA